MKSMKMKSVTKAALTASFMALSTFGTNSFAAVPATGANVGALIGYQTLAGAGGLAFGGRVGYKFDPSWSTGISFTTGSTTSATLTALSATQSTALILANFNYEFAGDMAGLFVGLKAGVGLSSTSAYTILTTVTPASSSTNFAIGAAVGYDYAIDKFSIGPVVEYLLVSSSGMFQGLAAIKYWF